MEKETFGVELQLITDKFKTKMSMLKRNIAQFSNETKAKFISGVNIDTTAANKRLDELTKRLETLKQIDSGNITVDKKEADKYGLNWSEGTGVFKDVKEQLIKVQSEIDGINEGLKETNTIAGKVGKTFQKLKNNFSAVGQRFKSSFNSEQNSSLFNSIKTGFDKGISSVKKFALSLFSLRSIWALISRASSVYIQNNDELQAETQLTSQIFAQTLAPVIKYVADALQYTAIGVARIVEMLTGMNILSKITAKSLNSTSKAAKSLNKQLAGFDEITNIGDTSGNLAGGLTDSLNAFNDFQSKVNEVDELFKKINMKEIINGIKDVTGLLWDKKGLIAGFTGALLAAKLFGGYSLNGSLIVGSLATTIGLTAQTVSEMKSLSEENKALANTLTKKKREETDAIISDTKARRENIKSRKEYSNVIEEEINRTGDVVNASNEEIKRLEKITNNIFYTKTAREAALANMKEECYRIELLIEENDKLYQSNLLNSDQIEKYKNQLVKQNNAYAVMIRNLEIGSDDFIACSKSINENTLRLIDLGLEETKEIARLNDLNSGLEKGSAEYQQNQNKIEELTNTKNKKLITAIDDEISKSKELMDSGKLTEKSYEAMRLKIERLSAERYNLVFKSIDQEIKKLEEENSQLDKSSEKYKQNKTRIEELQQQLVKLSRGEYSIEIKAETKSAKAKIEKFFKNMGSSMFSILFPSFSFSSILSKIASLDTGTNYVPSDQLAMIHKGEAVIPAKFNSKEYFNNYDNNERIEALLETLIDKIDDIDFSPYTTIKDVGEKSIQYINSQRRILGKDVI